MTVLLILVALCAVLLVVDLCLYLHSRGWDRGYEVGAAHLEEAVEQAFRAGFSAHKHAGEAVELDPDHVATQRQAGREGRQ